MSLLRWPETLRALAARIREYGTPILVALPIALIILAFVLGLSLALAVPFVFAVFTIGGTLLLLDVATRFVTISPYATNLVKLIGLGLAVDYSLLVVTRYREELRRGRPRDEAIARTMATAGRAVIFSGASVEARTTRP